MTDLVACINCTTPTKKSKITENGLCKPCQTIAYRQSKLKPEPKRTSLFENHSESAEDAAALAAVDTEVFKEADKQKLENEQLGREQLVKEAKKEEAARELARRRLLPFVRRFNKDYDPGWVHADVCRRLEKFSQDVRDKKSPRLMLFLPPRHGKQVADSTPVLTTSGWKTHGELKIGDHVFHPSGKPVKVLAISEKTPSDYVVELTNGDTIRCHGKHEWTVYNRSYGEYQTKETEWFISTTKFGKQREVAPSGRSMYQLPDVGSLEFPYKNLAMPPYTLGAWLGDGSRGKGCITHTPEDSPIVNRIERDGYRVSARCTHKTTGVVTTYFSGPKPGVAGELLKDLRAVGVLEDKYIPECYLRASIPQRLELLAGLVDTDGHVCRKSGRTRITTADRRLAEGVFDLCATLGFRPYTMVEQPKLSTSGVQGTREYYVIGFQPTIALPVALERKSTGVRALRRRFGLKSVRFEPNGEVGHCIEVDSPDGLYLVGRNLTPTHNSELSSRNFPAWHLGHCPNHEIIQASYSADLAVDFSRKVRELMRRKTYHNVFDTRLDPKTQAVERWATTEGGAYAAVGVRGPITGRGAHIGIIDDPVKDRQEAESQVLRQQIKDWYSSTFYTRLAPGGGVLIIMTRWHEDDLAGWLISLMEEAEKEARATGEWPDDADRWEVVRYPAIAEEDEAYRKAGEALHEGRYPIRALNKIKRTLINRDWIALYQQRPVAEDGDFFKREHFKFYAKHELPPLEAMNVYAAWDLALGKKDVHDYTACIIVGVDKRGFIWVLHVLRMKLSSLEIIDKLFDVQETWTPVLQGVEEGLIELAVEPVLLKTMDERRKHIPYEKLKVRGLDKVARAQPIRTRVEQGRVLLPLESDAAWVGPFLEELLKFPNGTFDDQVDGFAWIGQMLMLFAGAYSKKEDKRPKWLKKLKQLDKKRSRSAMTA